MLNSQPGLQPATTKHTVVRLCCCALLHNSTPARVHCAHALQLSRAAQLRRVRAPPSRRSGRAGARRNYLTAIRIGCAFLACRSFFGRAIEPSVHFCVLLTTLFEYYSSVVRCVCARFAYPFGSLYRVVRVFLECVVGTSEPRVWFPREELVLC